MFEMGTKIIALGLGVEAVALGVIFIGYLSTKTLVEQANLSISKKRMELAEAEIKVAEAQKTLVDVQVAFFEEAKKNNKEAIQNIAHSVLTSQFAAGRA